MRNRLFDKITAMNRRDLFRNGGALAALGAIRGGSGPAAAATLDIGKNIYQSIGVRPVINCKGTFTIISGSQTLPDVKRAMDEASRHYVNLDELMEGVGKRLAELTGAEWGIVTAGCAAAITHVTAACIAGSDPEKMQRLPMHPRIFVQVHRDLFGWTGVQHRLNDIIRKSHDQDQRRAHSGRGRCALRTARIRGR